MDWACRRKKLKAEHRLNVWISRQWESLGFSAHCIGLSPEKQAIVDAIALYAAKKRKEIRGEKTK